MTRVLTNQDSTITLTAYTAGTAADQGTFTIGIVDANGDTVVASGTAVTDNSDGTYEYVLPAQADPAALKATWTESAGQPIYTTEIEVVGSQLFNEFQARTKSISGQQTPLSDTANYTDAFIADWHDTIAGQFEEKSGRSWILRYARVELSGNGGYALNLTDGISRTSTGKRLKRPGRFNDIGRILSVTVDGTAQTVTDYVNDGIWLRATNGTWATPTVSDPLNVVVEYEYGIENDAEASENALRMLLANAIPSDVPGWAESWSNEDGSFTRGQSGFAYPSKVWEWLRRSDMRIPIG